MLIFHSYVSLPDGKVTHDRLFVRGLVGALAARWHSGGHNIDIISMPFYKDRGPPTAT